MLPTTPIIDTLKTKDWSSATQQTVGLLNQKMAERLAAERLDVGKTLIKEAADSKPDLRKDYDEKASVIDGTLYRKGSVVQVWWTQDSSGEKFTGDKGRETFSSYPTLQNAKSDFKSMKDRWNEMNESQVWARADGWSVGGPCGARRTADSQKPCKCPKCGQEEGLLYPPHLRGMGLTEGRNDTGFPSGWDQGWAYPYRIGSNGTETPFVKDGRWYLLVYNQKEGKREVYSFHDDMFFPEKEFYNEATDWLPSGGKVPASFGAKEPKWEKDPNCQQCRKPLSASDKSQGRVCSKCVKGNSGKIYAKEGCGKTLKEFPFGMQEEALPLADIQRVYDETGGDIGETELLCNVTRLTVNTKGQVIAAIGEAVGDDVTATMKRMNHTRIVSALTAYDRRREGKAGYNRYALPQYFQALEQAERRVEAGDDWRTALCNSFLGSLLDATLKAIGEPKASSDELRGWGRRSKLREDWSNEKCPKCGKKLWTREDGELWCTKCAASTPAKTPFKGSFGESVFTSPSVRALSEMVDHDGAFASDLGWKPGVWPKEATIDGAVYYRTGEMVRDPGGDIGYVIYRVKGHYNTNNQKLELHIFND